MIENKLSNEHLELISKYLSGNATDKEVRELETWVAISAENKAQFMSIKKAWLLAGIQAAEDRVNVEEEWQATSEILFGEGKVVEMKTASNLSRRNWLSIAAAIALLASVALWVFTRGGSGAPVTYAAQSELLSTNLSDGSAVTLNQFSTINFVPNAEGKYRQVELSGDAFFEVARDENHPFRIQAKAVEIEVLGTSFYVDARQDESDIRVIVKSGSVAVRSGDAAVVLKANESAVFNKTTRQLTKQQNEDVNFLAWSTKVLTFESSRLDEVVLALNRQYQSKIELADPGLGNCTITATFNNKTLEAVMRIIEKSMDVKVEGYPDKMIITGEGCEE